MAYNIAQSKIPGYYDKFEDLYKKFDNLDYRTKIIELQALGKITKEEMANLIKMLQSADEENHTVAKEVINNLIKTI